MKAIRNIVCVVLILAICVRVYERTGGETSEEAETPQAPVENVLTESYLFYPYQYASKNGIPLRENTAQGELAAWLSEQAILEQSPMAAETEFGLFSGTSYHLTSSDGEYYYRGETKDNEPDGFGMLSAPSGSLSGMERILYIGTFREGKYHGYGLLFAEPTSEDENVVLNLSYRGSGEEELRTIYHSFANYVCYEGEFKDGAPNGQGNRFSCSLYYSVLASQMSGADSLRLDDIGFTVTVGKFRDGSANGQVKQYRSGMLSYEGEMKNDKRDGRGTQYQSGSTAVLYEGEFKNDAYHGRSILYDENGQVVYSGKWKNGDYA